MWRLIAFILICAMFLVFVVVNLEHTSDVSIGFRTFTEIPVFLTAFSAFVFGMIFATPFAFSFGRKRKKSHPSPDILHNEGEKEAAGRKRFFGSKKKKASFDTAGADKDPALLMDEVKKENTPYGID